MKKTKLDDDLSELRSILDEGEISPYDVAGELGCSHSTVYGWIDAVNPRRPQAAMRARIRKFIADRRSGDGLDAIQNTTRLNLYIVATMRAMRLGYLALAQAADVGSDEIKDLIEGKGEWNPAVLSLVADALQIPLADLPVSAAERRMMSPGADEHMVDVYNCVQGDGWERLPAADLSHMDTAYRPVSQYPWKGDTKGFYGVRITGVNYETSGLWAPDGTILIYDTNETGPIDKESPMPIIANINGRMACAPVGSPVLSGKIIWSYPIKMVIYA